MQSSMFKDAKPKLGLETHEKFVSPRNPHTSYSRIGITGSHGTGKRSVARELSRLLNLETLSINEFAIRKGLGIWENNEFLVDIKRLTGRIDTADKIVVGHLLPYVIRDNQLDLVAVLRCSPSELQSRYSRRKYAPSKIAENLEAEAIGLVSAKCADIYQPWKIAEFDTSRVKQPRIIAKRILYTVTGKIPYTFGQIDWLSRAKSPESLARLLKGQNHTFNRTKKDN
jgi:adenylate kinase